MSFASQFRELRNHLLCSGCTLAVRKEAQESGEESDEEVYCLINPITMKHSRLTKAEMNYWSQEIVCDLTIRIRY